MNLPIVNARYDITHSIRGRFTATVERVIVQRERDGLPIRDHTGQPLTFTWAHCRVAKIIVPGSHRLPHPGDLIAVSTAMATFTKLEPTS